MTANPFISARLQPYDLASTAPTPAPVAEILPEPSKLNNEMRQSPHALSIRKQLHSIEDIPSERRRTEPREMAPARSRILSKVDVGQPIRPPAFVKAALKKLLYLRSGNLGALFATRSQENTKFSVLEPVTGNFNSLICRKNSLFFFEPR